MWGQGRLTIVKMQKKPAKRPFKRKPENYIRNEPYKLNHDRYEAVYDLDKCKLRDSEDGGKIPKRDCSQI